MDYKKQILDIIKEEVANYYHIPIEYIKMNIKERKRHKINVKEVGNARNIAMYLSMELTTIDSLFIANSFGIYDDDRMSARAFIVHYYGDTKDYYTNNDKVNKLKLICEKKINDKIEELRKSGIFDVIRYLI